MINGMKNQHDKTKSDLLLNDKIVVVSVGRHTRLGDVLEHALANVAFETVTADAFLTESWRNRRLLFAISTEHTNENTQLHLLTAHLKQSEDCLQGCVCVAIADGAQGKLAHLDAIVLLLAANHAGAMLPACSLLEADRELRYFSGGKTSPFERYRELAKSLIERLHAAQIPQIDSPRVRLLNVLDGGTANDWQALIDRTIKNRGCELVSDGLADETILLCENSDGLPDEKTHTLLNGSGALRLLIASPAAGQELFVAALFSRACLRGNYSLLPNAIVLFEGMSAVEVIAGHIPIDQLLAGKD